MKLFVYLVLLVLFSCASDPPKGDTEAEVLFKEALQLKDDEHYIQATARLNDLKNRFPYSYYATPAELLLADILFLQENYIDAAASYLVFKDFHPKHKKIPYVIYRIAESFFMQVPDTYDRDLSAAHEAIRYYNIILMNYVQSEYAKEANKKINTCKKMILSKEQYIADFYFKTEVYEAALWRYQYILKNFKNKKLTKHSMERSILASANLKKYNECNRYISAYSPIVDKEEISDAVELCTKKVK
jgi:outer membrane protein assembly factor BamD